MSVARRSHAYRKRIDRRALSSKEGRLRHVSLLLLGVVGAYDDFSYGTFSRPEPYSVHQLGGAYRSIPGFSAQPALRLQLPRMPRRTCSRVGCAFARELDNETARLQAEYAMGSHSA